MGCQDAIAVIDTSVGFNRRIYQALVRRMTQLKNAERRDRARWLVGGTGLRQTFGFLVTQSCEHSLDLLLQPHRIIR